MLPGKWGQGKWRRVRACTHASDASPAEKPLIAADPEQPTRSGDPETVLGSALRGASSCGTGTPIRPVKIVVSRMPVLYDVPAMAVAPVLRDARAGRFRKRAGRRLFAKLDGAVAPIPTVVPACADVRTRAIVRPPTYVATAREGPGEGKMIGLCAVRIQPFAAGPLIRKRGGSRCTGLPWLCWASRFW